MKKLLPFVILFLFLIPITLSAQAQYIFDFDTIGNHFAGDTIAVTIHGYDTLGIPYTGFAFLYISNQGNFVYWPTYGQTNMIVFSSGYWNGFIVVYTASDSLQLSVDAINVSEVNNCNYFDISPRNAEKLQILLPGEVNDPGNTDPFARGRKWISPFYCTAGILFDATVYITDEYWNPCNAGSDTVSFGSSNAFPILPPDTFLTNGTGQFSFIMRTASTNQTISVSKPSFFGDTLAADTSSAFPVYPGSFSKLLLIAPSLSLLPGDTTTNTYRLPGATPDSTDWQVAGSPFNISVYAVDDCWNPIGGSAPQDSIRLSGSIGTHTIVSTGILTGGNVIFSLTSDWSGYLYLQAEDITDTTKATKYPVPIKIAGSRYRVEADEEGDTIFTDIDPIHLHIYYEDESGSRITDDDHDIIIYTYTGSGSLTPVDTVIRALTSGMCEPVVYYSTSQEEDLYLEIASESPSRLTSPGRNVDPIHVMTALTPDRPVVNYPNPFGIEHKETTIYYWLPRGCDVKISIYDRFGNLVRKWEKNGVAGYNTLPWNGKNGKGAVVGNGAYLLAIRATDRTEIIKEYRRWIAVVK